MMPVVPHARAPDKRRVLFGVLVALLLAAFGWQVLGPHEPVYQGRPLSYWLDRQFQTGSYDLPGHSADATNAVRAIGPRALPLLLDWTATGDSIGRRVLSEMAREYRFLHLPGRQGRVEMAIWGFRVLGPEAESAVPSLTRLLQHRKANVRIAAAQALGALGPVARDAVPALISAVLNSSGGLTWQDTGLRGMAANALGEIGPAAEPALPHLAVLTNVLPAELAAMKIRGSSLLPFIERLKDTSDPEKWRQTAWLIGDLGTNGEPAIPSLLAALTSTNAIPRSKQWLIYSGALEAISRIHRRPDLCLPVLVRWLQVDDPTTRNIALRALRAFGPESKPAVPDILRCIQNSKQWIWLQREATNALRVIDPESVPNGGIERAP